MARRARKNRYVVPLVVAAGALTLAGSALGTPPSTSRAIAAVFPALTPTPKASPRPAPKPQPQPQPPQPEAAKNVAVSHAMRADQPLRAEARPQPAPGPAACGRHFLSPFEGPLNFRAAYRSGGVTQHCPHRSTFGPVRGGRNHWGVDISAPTGTSVRAATDGTVSYAREPGGYGLYARLKFSAQVRGKGGGCGSSDEYEIIYAHLIDDGKTSMATRSVRAGEMIGRVGCTGNAKGMCSPSPESHLHVTVQRSANRDKVEPGQFLGWNIHTPVDHPGDWASCLRPR